MRRELSQFIGVPYHYTNGPMTTLEEQSMPYGLNCQFLVHLIYQSFGIVLPTNMLSKEIFEDERLFMNVADPEDMRILDVVIFGREPEKDTRRLHLAVFTGEMDETGSPLLIHASNIGKQVSVWPLEKFSFYPQYKKIYTIKRWRNFMVHT